MPDGPIFGHGGSEGAYLVVGIGGAARIRGTYVVLVNDCSAACHSTRIWTSSDGLHWFRRAPRVTANHHLGTLSSGRGQLLGTITVERGITFHDVVAVSRDGITWRRLGSLPGNSAPLAQSSVGYVTVGAGTDPAGGPAIWTSTEGTTWTQRFQAPAGWTLDQIAANDLVVAVVASPNSVDDERAPVLVSIDGGVTWAQTGWSADVAGCVSSVAITATAIVAVGGGCQSASSAWIASLP